MLDRTFGVTRMMGHVISIGEAEGQPFKNFRERIRPRSQTFTRLDLGHVEQSSAAGEPASHIASRVSAKAG